MTGSLLFSQVVVDCHGVQPEPVSYLPVGQSFPLEVSHLLQDFGGYFKLCMDLDPPFRQL